MPKLILIKHASPQLTEGQPPEKWPLSEAGKAKCKPLAEALSAYMPLKFFSSEESKAVETAAEITKQLGSSYQTFAGLEEQDRSNVPVMQTRDFISLIELFFRKPNELVLGKETASTALSRMRSAIDELLTENPNDDLAIVSHGTVIALFIAHYTNKNGFQLWRQMTLPSFAVLSVPDFNLIEMTEKL